MCGSARSLADLRSERRFDVVHACNPPDTLLLAVRSLRRQGTRFVFDHHDLVPELYLSRFGGRSDAGHRAMLAAERLAYRLADVSLATNGSYARIAMSVGGWRLRTYSSCAMVPTWRASSR